MGLSEKDFCIKCGKGGKVLPCSDSCCPISVHKSCLGFPAQSDDIGNFCCPFCFYKRVTEEIRQAKEKVLISKRALSNFMEIDMINGNIHIDERNSQQKELGKLQDTGKGNNCLGSSNEIKLDEASIQKNEVQHKEGQEDEFSESARSIPLHKETGVVLIGKKNNVLSTKYGDNPKCNDCWVQVGYQTPIGPIVACGNIDICSEEEERVRRSQMIEIGRQILLKHRKQLTDNQPAGTDRDFSDAPIGKKQKMENLSSSVKSVDKNVDPIQYHEEKNGVQEMKKQVQESNSLFGTHPATPVLLDPPTDVNCLSRSCRISSSALTKIEKLDLPDSLKQVAELSTKYGDNTKCSDRLVQVCYQTPSGPIVACGNNDIYSEEEERVHRFQMIEIGRRILLKHQKQLIDNQPARTDRYFADAPIGGKQETGNLSSSVKSVDKNADPIQYRKHKNGVQEMKKQVQESNSPFGTDPVSPVPLEEKEGFSSADALCKKLDAATACKCVEIKDKRCGPSADVNCLRRSYQISSSALKAKTEKIEKLNLYNSLKQVTDPSPKFSENSLPSSRHKKLLWTDDVDKMLREGVCKYSTTKAIIPWRKTMEFGRHVFHDIRTPVDLKDKWRKLLAKEA